MNRQDSTTDQLKDVIKKAEEMGCYDAADWILRRMYLKDKKDENSNQG